MSKEAQTFDIIAIILNGTWRPGYVFMTSFCPNGFQQAFLTTTLVYAAPGQYCFDSNMLQIPIMMAAKIVK